jgi:integrase
LATKSTKRRSPGEGGASPYTTRAGERWLWKTTLTLADGSRKQVMRRGFETKKAALADLRDALAASGRTGYAEPSKILLGEYLAGWLDSLRLAPSTVASYRKNVRLHIAPNVGSIPLASLTPVTLDKLYKRLETGGRADHKAGQGLSARTVRYIHTILSSALRDAVDAGMLPANPAARAHPPTAKQAASPEMHPWDARQLKAFLAWARENSELHAAWHVLAHTGMRRGELLGLRWRDVDLDAATITVRRSAGLIRNAGEGADVVEGPTKTGKPRVIDLDPGTAEVLRAWKRERGGLALVLARDDALVFGDLNGQHRQPEHFSRTWLQTVQRAIRDGIDVPEIRLHDLRHTFATSQKIGRIASDASFGSLRERALPAPLRVELRCGRPDEPLRGCGDLGLRRPSASDATMMQLISLRCAHHHCGCWHRDAPGSSRLHRVHHRLTQRAAPGRHRSCEGRAGPPHHWSRHAPDLPTSRSRCT